MWAPVSRIVGLLFAGVCLVMLSGCSDARPTTRPASLRSLSTHEVERIASELTAATLNWSVLRNGEPGSLVIDRIDNETSGTQFDLKLLAEKLQSQLHNAKIHGLSADLVVSQSAYEVVQNWVEYRKGREVKYTFALIFKKSGERLWSTQSHIVDRVYEKR